MTPTQQPENPFPHVARPAAPPRFPHPLRQLTAALAARSNGVEGRHVMARFERAGVPLGPCADPLALARACQPGGDPRHAAAVVRALSSLVPEDETAGLCLLVGFVPALEQMAGWLVGHGIPRADAEVTAIAALWEAASVPGAREGNRLFTAAWTALRHELRAELRHRRTSTRVEDVDHALTASDVADCFETLLSDAVRAGGLSAEQAGLLKLLYVDDVPAWAVATLSGRTVRAVSKARRQAEDALHAYVTRPEPR